MKAGKAKTLIVASDTSDSAKRRAEGYVFETNTVLVEVPFTKLEIAGITGKVGCSMAAITDLGLAAAFVKALNAECDGKYSEAQQRLSEAQQRAESAKPPKAPDAAAKRVTGGKVYE